MRDVMTWALWSLYLMFLTVLVKILSSYGYGDRQTESQCRVCQYQKCDYELFNFPESGICLKSKNSVFASQKTPLIHYKDQSVHAV